MSSVPVKFIYFDINTKTEVEAVNIDEYLENNPTAALVECIRRGDAVINNQEPKVERLVPEEENTALTQLVSGESVGNPSLLSLTWVSHSCGKRDYVQPGISWSSQAGHTLPFDSRIRGISVSYSRLTNNQDLGIILGDSNHNQKTYDPDLTLASDFDGFHVETYWTPSLGRTWQPDSYTEYDLDIYVPAGTLIRIKSASRNGRFSNIAVTLIIEKVSNNGS